MTGAADGDVHRAYVVERATVGVPDLWAAVAAQDGRIPVSAQIAVYLNTRRLLDRAVRWLLQNRRAPLDVTAEIAALRPGVARLLPRLNSLYRGAEREALRRQVASLVAQGVPEDLADWTTRLRYGFGLLDVVEVSTAHQRDPAEVAEVYFALSERFRVDAVLSNVSLPRRTGGSP